MSPILPGMAERAISESDRQRIQSIISAQISAFQVDDAQAAFDFASPEIQAKFGTPTQFLDMVRNNYKAVYRPSAVFFQELRVIQGEHTQRVLIMDAMGAPVLAIYPMQRQDDGSWRINGCYLFDSDATML